MCEETVTDMTKRLTEFADAALEHADMKVKLSKTYTQHVKPQVKNTSTHVSLRRRGAKNDSRQR